MHGVVGGGTMNMLVEEKFTYRRPHCVHCQLVRVVLASAMLIAGTVDIEEKGRKGTKMTYAGISSMDVEGVFRDYTAEEMVTKAIVVKENRHSGWHCQAQRLTVKQSHFAALVQICSTRILDIGGNKEYKRVSSSTRQFTNT